MAATANEQGGTFYKAGQYAKYVLPPFLLCQVSLLTKKNLSGRKNAMN